jgi:hypothetical protein
MNPAPNPFSMLINLIRMFCPADEPVEQSKTEVFKELVIEETGQMLQIIKEDGKSGFKWRNSGGLTSAAYVWPYKEARAFAKELREKIDISELTFLVEPEDKKTQEDVPIITIETDKEAK